MSPQDSAQTRLCEACGAVVGRTQLFCHRCTFPVSVPALAELDSADLDLCLSSLSELLREVGAERAEPTEPFLAYLSAFWLRPETALILAAEAQAIASLPPHAGPWLDLGCGDGVHAALYRGWRFESQFDVFQCVDPSARDIFHHWDRSRFRAEVVRRGEPIDLGIDIKSTAVERASALGAFHRVQRADATSLPIEAQSVGTIYSNMLRDLGDPLPAALAECRRVLRPGGRLILSAMTPDYPHSLHFVARARATSDPALAERLLRLDRGRSVFCRRQLTPQQWSAVLASAGLTLERAVPIVGPRIIRFWDVGLRPFSPALLAWRDRLGAAGLLNRLKPALVAAAGELLAPLARDPLAGGSPCMQLLVAVRP